MTLIGPDRHDVLSPGMAPSRSVVTIYSPSSSLVTQNPLLVFISLLPDASCQHGLPQPVFFLHHDLWPADIPGPQILLDQQPLAT